MTLAPVPVDGKTNEHKTALDLLREVPPTDAVVTADAIFTHRDFCQVVRDGGGDDLLPVQENQPPLRRDIQAAFAPEPGLTPRQQQLVAQQQQQAREVTKGHGRREVRRLRTATLLNDDLADWPDVQQVYWRRRERTEDGRTSVEDEYGITSLPRDRADATRLLVLRRGPWGIENRLHYVRDVTLGEDACRVRTGAAGVLAGLRNAALALLASLGFASMTEATRHSLFRPKRAIRLLFNSG